MNNLTLYEDLRNEIFKLEDRKKSLIKERDNIIATIDELQRLIGDLDFILCQHGKHIYPNYIEDTEVERGNENDSTMDDN